MLTLTQAVSRVAARLNKNANDTTVFNRIKNHINDVCLEKWLGYAWSFRFREYPLVLTAVVESGTLTATNGSRTVTASGTPFSSVVHVGAWINFKQDSTQALYRVLSVDSTSTVTIEPAYQGTTGSSKTYQLSKTDYLIPTEIVDTASLKLMYNGRPLTPTHQTISDYRLMPPLVVGAPTNLSIFNQSQKETTYTTGTLSGTINTVTLTGVGTSWLDNVKEGDEILISGDDNVYNVFSVDSNTAITLYQKLKVAASGASYTITRKFGKVIRVTHASDQAYVAFIKGLRHYFPLINNADTNELLARFPHAVIEGAIWREAGSSPDPREDSIYMKSEAMWARAQSEDEAIIPQHNPNPIWNPR